VPHTGPVAPNTWRWSDRNDTAPVWPGSPDELGATWTPEATTFAVRSPESTAAWLCLFDDAGDETRHRLTEHTLGVWHGTLPGVPRGQLYGFRVDGPWDPSRGLRFNPHKLLLDPYGLAVHGEVTVDAALHAHDRHDLRRRNETDSAPYVPRSVVVHDDFDWGDDAPPLRSWQDTVIYEVHTKGFTALHDRVPEQLRGTYAGLASDPVIDYLLDLGVTAVELLPVHHFVSELAVMRRGLSNYWGYNSIGYFAPHAAYSSSGTRGEQVTEFKAMVKRFHEAGLEVLLDVVYNHTAEGGADGPTYSFRGLDDLGFYKRAGGVADTYWDVTGCGNTVDAANFGALRLILDSLRHWVAEMHVDGFRFDLASALARTDHAVDMRSAFLSAVGQDPSLRRSKLIAEPWDLSVDGYLVGAFPPPWTEWNDKYRDAVRDFWANGGAPVRDVASRLAGSSDLYADDGRSPYASVNFVTSHDGFTLRDVVSYDRKHNLANGEGNRDGTDDNHSSNHGVEGETDDADILALRRRQAANMLVTLCLSSGVPMLTAGDERGRTQRGNNNPYCQDNEISWVDWRDDDAWLDLHEIVRKALQLRKAHPALRQRHHFRGTPTIPGGPKDLAWLHPDGREMSDPDWYDADLRTLGVFVTGDPLRAPGSRGEQQRDRSFLLWLNAQPESCDVRLMANPWVERGEVVLSTDPHLPDGTVAKAEESLRLAGRSVVLLRETD
jgi:glycogen debranching enzyme GlgX